MIDPATTAATYNALRKAIDVAQAVAERAEIADARALLADLASAASAYGSAAAGVTKAYADWRKDYADKFALLDRHSIYTLSLTTTAPSSLTFADDTTTHDLLVTRSNTAAASAAPSAALTDLARYKAAFDTSWSAKPASEISDGSTQGVALLAAITKAEACTAFITWAKTNP